MIRSPQRQMLRLIVPNKVKIQEESPSPVETWNKTKTKKQTTEAQMKKLQKVAVPTQIATKTATISFMNDTEEEVDTSETEEEDWD